MENLEVGVKKEELTFIPWLRVAELRNPLIGSMPLPGWKVFGRRVWPRVFIPKKPALLSYWNFWSWDKACSILTLVS